MDISDWRKKIDEVDAAVLKLVNLRADMAIEIGKLKSQEGIGLRVPAREREIVDRAKAILIRERRIGEPDAYRWLRTRAMSTGRRIPDIAREVVARGSGQAPALDQPPCRKQGEDEAALFALFIRGAYGRRLPAP